MKVPKGTKDSSPTEERLKQKISKDCEKIFINYAAVRIDTPTFELYDLLMNKYDNEKEIFILENKKQLGEKTALRYDLTVPFSRYVKNNGIKKMRRYQIGKVFRRDKPSPGRYREFTQCDYDCLGKNDEILTDIETLNLLNTILTKLRTKYNLPEYVIRVNSREILSEIMSLCNIPIELHKTICSSIDKLDKFSWETVKLEISEKGLNDESIRLLSESLFNNNYFAQNNNKIKRILDTVENTKLDLTLARGLEYYTGVIFEVVLKDINGASISGGGRYDNLMDIPCIGFSLGIDRIMNYVTFDFQQKIKVWVVEINRSKSEVITDYRMKIVNDLRKNGICVGTDMKTKTPTLKKSFKYAAENKIPFVIIIGETEVTNNQVTIKNMNTQKQTTISYQDICNFIEVIKIDN